MDDFQKISTRAWVYLFLILIIENTFLAAAWLAVGRYISVRWQMVALLGIEVILVLVSFLAANLLARWLLSPLKHLWQVVLNLAPKSTAPPPPDINNLHLGRELVANLTRQIYQLAAAGKASAPAAASKLDFISNNLPLPLFVIDESDKLQFTNAAAAEYLGRARDEMMGKSIYDLLDMSFASDETFEVWLKNARASAAVTKKSWDHVKLNLNDGQSTSQFDLAAYYNKGNASHFETILVLFDQTANYSSEDDQASFVALAVHELRNPLTMLRGYIEVLEEEVDDKSNLELTTDLQKMRASAQLLADYTNNILNVSRVDSDQLSLHLKSEDWPALVKKVVDSMSLRARVHGKKLEVNLANGLPPVGADSVSMSEVLTNLIDNAIKYSHSDKPITIASGLNHNGEVETTVNDYGIVIDPSVIGNLFQKFYRNHRSRSEASGTGLGLYLSKAFVEAHGGNIWVSSNEKDGTTFGFTVLPYDKVSEQQRTGAATADDIVRVPHGWIKNHSLYRR